MRGNFETVAAGEGPSPISIAGNLIKYGFYTIGMLVLGIIGLGIMSLWKIPPKPIDVPPAFRTTAQGLSRLPVTGHLLSSSLIGRAEVRQYGRLTNRDIDLAVVLFMPPKGVGMGTEFVQDLRTLNLLKMTRMSMTQTHYDMDTRFSEFCGTEMRVDTDSRWKQCIAFRSRFDSPSVYVAGWYCDATGTKPSADAVACMLDKLVLDKELDSKEADTFLREKMTKRANCMGSPVTQTTATGSRRVSSPYRWSQPSPTYSYNRYRYY